MDNIIYTLNGRNYLLVEVMLTLNNATTLKEKVKQCECIEQGISQIDRGGLFGGGYAIIKILVPENKLKLWQENKDDVL